MRTWAFMLSGLIVWAIHFFTLYIVASIWLSSPLARMLTVGLTLGCLAVLIVLMRRARRDRRREPLDAWSRAIASPGLALAGIAVLWQGLPALLV